MPSRNPTLRRLGLLALAALCAVFVAACGGGSSDEDAAVSEAISAVILSEDEESLCNELVSERFVSDVYGDVETCVAAEAAGSGEDPDEIRVSEIKVDGDSASAIVAEVGGDTDGATGTVTVVRVDDAWRVDGIGIDYLRSQLDQGFANEDEFTEDEYGPLADAAVRDCVTEGFQALDDDAFRAMAYASKADQEPTEDFIAVLTDCMES